jgi:hypothetical protein
MLNSGYGTTLTDEQWALMEPLIRQPKSVADDVLQT